MARGSETRTRILDAAEALFAQHDYDAVSMRDIVGRAGVRLALVTYHFGTKDALFDELIRRRFGVLDQERRANLAVLEARAGYDVEMLLEGFISPYLKMMVNGDPGWNNYGRLIAKANHSERWLKFSTRYFDATAELYIEALHRIYPKAQRLAIVRAFFFTIVLMTHSFGQHRRIEKLSKGGIAANDFLAAYRDLMRYAPGGIRGLIEAAMAEDKPAPAAARPPVRKPRRVA